MKKQRKFTQKEWKEIGIRAKIDYWAHDLSFRQMTSDEQHILCSFGWYDRNSNHINICKLYTRIALAVAEDE